MSNTFRTPSIHAFEPSSETFKILEDNHRYGEPRVILHDFALGRTEETREFINYELPYFGSFLRIKSKEENWFKNIVHKNSEQVKVGTVDRFIADQKFNQVVILKIDTQGFDLEVLLGVEQVLNNRSIKLVLIE